MKPKTRWWQQIEVWILIFFIVALLCNWIWYEYKLHELESQLKGLPK